MKYKPLLGALLCITVTCCTKNDGPIPIDAPIPGEQLVQLPVVVHMIHNGEDIGQGPNLSKERILRQIEILNEDFRKKRVQKDTMSILMERIPKLNLYWPNPTLSLNLLMASTELMFQKNKWMI